MGVKLVSASAGSVEIVPPTTASNFTATMPAATGTVMVSGNMPAFSAYPSSNQLLTAATATKILFDTEVFDTNSNFASSRFTPTVAGYYQLNGTLGPTSATAGTGAQALIRFYVNGALYMQGNNLAISGVNVINISALIYFNGSTDYVEVYGYLNGTSLTINGALTSTSFNGALVRGA